MGDERKYGKRMFQFIMHWIIFIRTLDILAVRTVPLYQYQRHVQRASPELYYRDGCDVAGQTVAMVF